MIANVRRTLTVFYYAAQVERMAKLMNVAGDMAYTCESAGYFWLLHVLSRWEKFVADCRQRRTPHCVQDLFPFKVSHPCHVTAILLLLQVLPT